MAKRVAQYAERKREKERERERKREKERNQSHIDDTSSTTRLIFSASQQQQFANIQFTLPNVIGFEILSDVYDLTSNQTLILPHMVIDCGPPAD